MPFLFLAGGLLLLLVGGHFLVSGGVSLSRHFRISTLVVGMTVVAFGTSAPELIVSVKANFQDHPDITVGNVIGSNIANIALVLSLTTVIMPIVLRKKSIMADWLAMLASFFMLILFAYDGTIALWEGAILVFSLAFYICRSLASSRSKSDGKTDPPEYSILLSIVITASAIIALSFGADYLVLGASDLARSFGVSEKAISVSLVAFGTSVPELATSIAAAIRKEMDISIGNIIGSNIFNTLAVIGITAITKPIAIDGFLSKYAIDFIAMFAFGILLMLAMLPLKRGKIDRWKGAVMFAGYASYIYMLF